MIAGATVGGVVAVILAVLVLLFWIRRRRHRHSSTQPLDMETETTEVHPTMYTVEPFIPAQTSQPTAPSHVTSSVPASRCVSDLITWSIAVDCSHDLVLVGKAHHSYHLQYQVTQRRALLLPTTSMEGRVLPSPRVLLPLW